MTAPLVLGIDSQPLRLGLALVTLEDPAPIWADTFHLRQPGARLDVEVGRRVRDGLRRAGAEAERVDGAVVRVGIERAIVGGPHTSLDTCWDSGGVFALAVDGCRRVWKGTRLRMLALRPGQWKVAALGPGHGNDKVDQYVAWARRWAREAGWDEVRLNGLRESDACAALGIGVGAVREGGAS